MAARALVISLVLLLAAVARGQTGADAAEWLADLQAEVAEDLVHGRPLVVQVHVPLCDDAIIPCGNRRLGDGDNPGTNLYWATSGGFVGWFGRKGSGWKLVATLPADGDVLETRVWKRSLTPRGAFAKLGVDERFDLYVVAFAWRGSAIVDAMNAYVADLYGDEARVVRLDDGTEIRAGGAAHVVAYVGHNGWMDVDDYPFGAGEGTRASRRKKGTIAVACVTEDYLADDVPAPGRVPLLMTRWMLFAGAHGFEGAISAFAEGGTLRDIRRGAVHAYAKGQGKSARKVDGAFTNPSYRRWKHD